MRLATQSVGGGGRGGGKREKAVGSTHMLRIFRREAPETWGRV